MPVRTARLQPEERRLRFVFFGLAPRDGEFIDRRIQHQDRGAETIAVFNDKRDRIADGVFNPAFESIVVLASSQRGIEISSYLSDGAGYRGPTSIPIFRNNSTNLGCDFT